jgi:hypothetical protein
MTGTSLLLKLAYSLASYSAMLLNMLTQMRVSESDKF